MDRHVKLSALALIVVLIGLLATLPRPPAVAANPLTGVTALATGWSHTCALMDSGDVMCWGSNDSGQLGDGTNTDRARPVAVEGLHDVLSIDAGSSFTCALTGGGAVTCWGGNFFGQLGDGSRDDRSVPSNVIGLSAGAVDIGVGVGHACAVTGEGEVFCWGDAANGQLGAASLPPIEPTPVPVLVEGLDVPIEAVAGGEHHTCALAASGTVKCWGASWGGNLGDGSEPGGDAISPVDAAGLSDVTQISVGSYTTCAVTESDKLYCWGRHIGVETDDVTWVPTEVTTLDAPPLTVSVGRASVCVVLTSGNVECWGDNSYGNLGDGTLEASFTPVEVNLGDLKASVISIGIRHTCAVVDDGGVWCWGGNLGGKLGNVTTDSCEVARPFAPCSLTPLPVLTKQIARGDVDCDGTVNAIDAVRILQATAGLLDRPLCGESDINHDGVTDSIDAVLLLQFEAGLLEELPA
ncbi:MAG: chromosome condensation regulator RCC1 [Chloroflexi bacterium]|nr:chromosome condensation regulator RCC1 [Chloroflexota bacterium]